MHPNDAEGIANSVDPDQTDLGSALFAQTCLSEKLRNIMVLPVLYQCYFYLISDFEDLFDDEDLS